MFSVETFFIPSNLSGEQTTIYMNESYVVKLVKSKKKKKF